MKAQQAHGGLSHLARCAGQALNQVIAVEAELSQQ